MWNGAFSPSVRKHRDYAHDTFFEHELSHGATYALAPAPVMVGTNPVNDDLFEPSREYYMMDFDAHGGSKYLYLIPAEPDNSEPNRRRIANTMDEYVKNPVEGGRDVNDYIDFDEGVEPEVVRWMVERGHGNKVDFRYTVPLDDEFNL